ncbi:MAG: hypothetical protein OSB38_11125 [Paraburkholderia fungorum]|nr:hypothetical protein [Paraburkholderia fungorum]
MRVAYLMLVHDNPDHFKRVVRKLSSESACFFVHVDKKADLESFKSFEHPNLQFCTERLDCAWGHISLVDATLKLMRLALSSGALCDYFVLLSGACYPLHYPEYIEMFFNRNRGTEFIEIFKFPNIQYGKPIERLTRYWIRKGGPFNFLRWRMQKILNFLLPARRYDIALGSACPMAGSQWWALSRSAVSYTLNFLDEHPCFYKFFRHVDCPDELVFQTVLWNSDFRSKISHSLTFTHWLPNSRGPEDIDLNFIDIFRKTPVLDSPYNNCPHVKREVVFARKFCRNSNVLDLIDKLVVNKFGEG